VMKTNVPPVSNVAKGLIRVQMTGVRPMAMEMLRTRSLSRCALVRVRPLNCALVTYSISPKGGRHMLGVTPSTSLMTLRDHPSSAII
jgi:hypothetical protein